MTDAYESLLASYASKPSASQGRCVPEEPSPTRNPFQRDRDRIIHSVAFRRLKNKSQVFVIHEGDHFRTRLTHTLEVAQIARALARSLNVQEDLAEAVALAHDLGHPPFGHCGEDALHACMKDFGGFNHNDQSMRVVTKLERRYAAFDGLNLSWEVLEGLAKHNGPVTKKPLPPTIAAVDQMCNLRLNTWAGIEAQIGNLSDDIAYNNHDIDDGMRAGFFTIKDLYDLPLIGAIAQHVKEKYSGVERSVQANEIVRRLMGLMIADVLKETHSRLNVLQPNSTEDIRTADRPMVAFSDTMNDSIASLRAFLFGRMYRHWKVQRLRDKMAQVVTDLFTAFFDKPHLLPPSWQAKIAAEGEGARDAGRARIVLDYVAGMTDSFALQEHRRLFDFYAIEGLPSV